MKYSCSELIISGELVASWINGMWALDESADCGDGRPVYYKQYVSGRAHLSYTGSAWVIQGDGQEVCGNTGEMRAFSTALTPHEVVEWEYHTSQFTVHMTRGDYPSEVSWQIDDGLIYSYNTAYQETPLYVYWYYEMYNHHYLGPWIVSLSVGNHTLHMLDSYDDGWNEAMWTLQQAGTLYVYYYSTEDSSEADPTRVAGPFTFEDGYSASEVFTVTALVAATEGPGSGNWSVDSTVAVVCAPTAAPTAAPTVAPTASPTNFGDTNTPSALPTAATNSPTSTPTVSIVFDWNAVEEACSAGSIHIVLSDSFMMGPYTEQCVFSGRKLTVQCNGATLDAAKNGRFFTGSGSGSALELHGCTLQSGTVRTRYSYY
jgi:hypothetical protein